MNAAQTTPNAATPMGMRDFCEAAESIRMQMAVSGARGLSYRQQFKRRMRTQAHGLSDVHWVYLLITLAQMTPGPAAAPRVRTFRAAKRLGARRV